MSIKSLNRISDIIETPSINVGVQEQNITNAGISQRTCINTLRKRLIESKKKDKLKNVVIVSSVLLSVGVISFIVG